MNIDISKIVIDKIKDMEEKKVVENAIEETIEKSIVKAVKDALESYRLRHTIEEKVEKEVSAVVSQIGFTGYNGFIAEKIKQIVEETCNADIAEKIEKTFNGILVIKRDSIKLSEICEKYKEYICNNTDESEKYELESFYVSVEEEGSPYNWLTFKFAKEKSKYHSYGNNEIEFTVHRNKDGKTGRISTVLIGGNAIDEKLNFGRMSDMEKLLCNIAYNKTPIEIDVECEDDIDNYFDIDN